MARLVTVEMRFTRTVDRDDLDDNQLKVITGEDIGRYVTQIEEVFEAEGEIKVTVEAV